MDPTATDPRTTTRTTTRIGDRERLRAQSVLATAHAQGYLDHAELDARLDRVLAARTAADLAATSVDLPVARLLHDDPAAVARRRHQARTALRVHAATFAGMTTLLVTIWLAVALGTGTWFPWPVFPVTAGLLALVGHRVTGISGVRGTVLCAGRRR